MKLIISVAAALGVASLLCAACGGTTSPPNTTTPTSAPSTMAPTTTVARTATTKREAATFLEIIAPFNAATTRIDLSGAKPMTTAELQVFLAPLAKASNTLVSAILSAAFTGLAATPARTMAIAAEAVVADIGSVTASNWSSEEPVIARDEATVGKEDRLVRADLDIPATS